MVHVRGIVDLLDTEGRIIDADRCPATGRGWQREYSLQLTTYAIITPGATECTGFHCHEDEVCATCAADLRHRSRGSAVCRDALPDGAGSDERWHLQCRAAEVRFAHADIVDTGASASGNLAASLRIRMAQNVMSLSGIRFPQGLRCEATTSWSRNWRRGCIVPSLIPRAIAVASLNVTHPDVGG
jgi:hypothetical protein